MAGRKTEQREATRREIVEVAARLFAEDGYDATSIEDVLRSTGLSRGALYHHFPSKRDLFEAVFDQTECGLMDAVLAEAMKQPDPLAMLRAGCRAWLDACMRPAVRRITLIDAPAVLGWQRWRQIDEAHGFGLIKGALAEAVAEGLVDEHPIDVSAHLLLAALAEAAMVIARAGDPSAARADAWSVIDRLIGSLKTPREAVRTDARRR